MPEYNTRIELLIVADSPEDAVLESEAMLTDPARGPFVWDVREADTDYAWDEIDAEKLNPPPVWLRGSDD